MQPLQSRLLLNWKRKRCVLSLPARILCTWVCSKLLSFVPGNPVLSCRCFAAHGGTVAEPNAEPDPVRDSNAKSKCNTDTDTKLNALVIADAKPDPVRDGDAKSKCITDTDTKLNALVIADAKPDPVRDGNAKSKCNTDTDTKLNALAVTLGHIVNLNFGHRLAVVLANSVCDLITYSFEHSNE